MTFLGIFSTISSIRKNGWYWNYCCRWAHPTTSYNEVLKDDIDICVIGEGEETSEIVETFMHNGRKKLSLSKINDCIFK